MTRMPWPFTLRFLRGLALLCFALCALAAVPASADTIYTYSGNPLSQVICTTCGVTPSNLLSGTVTLSSALNPNLAALNAAPLLTSYFFTDGVQTADNTTTTPNFWVSTNAAGQITAWDFEAWSFTTGVDEFQTTSGIFTCRPNGCSSGNGDSVSLANITLVAQNSKPGSWQQGSGGTVPEPSSLLLLIAGLLGFAPWLSRRLRLL